MAKLTARRTEGGQFTPEDTLEVTFDYDGTLRYCVHFLEIVSGGEVTHGGGAGSSTPLHYKAMEEDADGDGVIDYSTVTMRLVQTVKGTTVVKACASLITTEEFNTYQTNIDNWEKQTVQSATHLVILQILANKTFITTLIIKHMKLMRVLS